MEVAPANARKVRFGTFEVDFPNRELRNRGLKIKLQEKPFRILELLLAKPGELVTREELFQHLWPGLNVNFERSLNTALNLLRDALDDSPRASRFIETRSGRGYRFIAPVEEIAEPNSHPRTSSYAERSTESRGYEDYLKGRYFCEKRTEDAVCKGIAHFRSAIAQDLHCALAYAGLADAYTLCAYLGSLAPIEAGLRAKDCAARALQLSPALPEAHAAIAAVKASFEWDWQGAEAEYLAALEWKPNHAEACRGYALLLARMGRSSEAARLLREAHNLNPLSPLICAEAGWISYLAGNFDIAIEQCWKALTIEPAFAFAQYTLALGYYSLGRIDEAVTEFENARICSGDSPAMAAAVAYVYATCGRVNDALSILQTLEQASKTRYISHYWLSLIWIGLGRCDRALELIESAREQRDVWLTFLAVEPRMKTLRAHAAFQHTLNIVGLSNCATSVEAPYSERNAGSGS